MRSAVRLILLGVLCGAGWGVAARVWMRLISTDPTFTWSGTLFIVGASAFAGLGMGIVMALGQRLRGIGVATMLPLGLGPGMIMLPTVALGGMALRWRARRRLAAVLAAMGVLSAGLLAGGLLLSELSFVRAVICFVLYLGLTAWLAAMLAVSLRPRQRSSGDVQRAIDVMPVGRADTGVGPCARTIARRDFDAGHEVRGGRLHLIEDLERVDEPAGIEVDQRSRDERRPVVEHGDRPAETGVVEPALHGGRTVAEGERCDERPAEAVRLERSIGEQARRAIAMSDVRCLATHRSSRPRRGGHRRAGSWVCVTAHVDRRSLW